MNDSMVRYFGKFGTLSSEAMDFILKKVFFKQFVKRSHILHAGNICDHLFFIDKGAVRYYFKHGDRDLTTDISIDGELVTSFGSLVSRKPSKENIEVIEDADLYGIHYDDLQEIYANFPEMNIVGRLIAEKHYISLTEHAYIMKYGSTVERYEYLMKHKPELIRKVPLGMIASYLGMTLETLSRVRKKYQG
jgi:CRP-like cAMP-binding protein